ncbi:hypothetical protein [Streptomyces lavendulocolor]|uniref:hypothetical protein n=1 Tax=Streptomyces lavendulocolor TaxID=67316 RepID=UPI003C2FF071
MRLPDGRTALSQRLGAPLANAAAPALIAAGPGPRGHATAGDRYTSTTAAAAKARREAEGATAVEIVRVKPGE